MTHIYPKISNL